jgi:hypothetical protein
MTDWQPFIDFQDGFHLENGGTVPLLRFPESACFI